MTSIQPDLSLLHDENMISSTSSTSLWTLLTSSSSSLLVDLSSDMTLTMVLFGACVTVCAVFMYILSTNDGTQQQRRRRKKQSQGGGRHRKPFDGLPMANNCHWLLGHLQLFNGDFRTTQKTFFKPATNEYGQVGFWMGFQKSIFVSHWEDARTVLHSEYYRIRVPLTKKHLDMFIGTRGIGTMGAREWRFHRAFLMKAFSRKAVDDSISTIIESTCELAQSIKGKYLHSCSDEVVLDLENITKMITMDVFGKVGLSRDFGCCKNLEASEVATSFDLLSSELAKRLSNPVWLPNYFYSIPTPANRRHKKARSCLRSLLKNAIAERRDGQKQVITEGCSGESSSSSNDTSKRVDLLDLMLHAHEELKREVGDDKERADDLEELLGDTMMSLLFAGYDTTSITLTYALYMISQNPEVEHLCLEEIRSKPETATYCKGVILETLRMYPPAPAVPRTLLKPVKLRGGFVAPKGAHTIVPIWLIHQDESAFPQPDQFRPDRWVRRDDQQANRWVDREEGHTADDDVDATSSSSCSSIPAANRKAFLAFSAGARSCPGQRFAMQEAIGALAELLKEFTFEPTPGYVLRPSRRGIVQRPKDGMPVKLRLRVSDHP